MARDDSVRTARGKHVVRDDELRIRTTPRGIVREKRLDWEKSGRLRRWASVVTTLFTVGTFASIVRDVLGFPDRLLSMGSAVSVAVVVVAIIGARWASLRWRQDPTVPLSTIREVEHERANGARDDEDETGGSKLGLVHFPGSDGGETEIEFPSEEEAERAVQSLRYRGIRVFDLDDRSRRPTLDGKRNATGRATPR
ncbi:hypothetical protein [Haladaptatus sp. CMAA 1911]|uniref:hypothetical protein n=1 Tax=unclassified Haladaptatus TaxID=2622732 RepID=UPI0037547C80